MQERNLHPQPVAIRLIINFVNVNALKFRMRTAVAGLISSHQEDSPITFLQSWYILLWEKWENGSDVKGTV